MESSRIDRVARALGSAATRRAALGALAALLASGAIPAGAKKKKKKTCEPACPAGQTCKKGVCRCDNGGVACGDACCAAGQSCQGGTCVSSGTWRHIASFGKDGLAENDTDGILENPFGVTVDPAGSTAWVSDSSSSRITVWRKAGAGWNHVGNFGEHGQAFWPGDGRLLSPRGVAVSADGSAAWVADMGNDRIEGWLADGGPASWTPVDSFGGEDLVNDIPPILDGPTGVIMDPGGTVAWVADGQNRRIATFAKSSEGWGLASSFGSEGTATGASQTDGLLGYPTSISANAARSTLVISDSRNHRVVVWKQAGGWRHVASFGIEGSATGASQTDGFLKQPMGVAVDPAGTTAWVVDANTRVTVWRERDGAWSHVASFGTEGMATGQSQSDGLLKAPSAVAVNAAGSAVWVTDLWNHRVVVWSV